MTFSYRAKDELCKLDYKLDCCKRAECYATLLFLKFFNKDKQAHTENVIIARTLGEKLTELTGVITRMVLHYMKKGFVLNIPDTEDEKTVMKYFAIGDEIINYDNLICEKCLYAFLKGAFVACGVISDPKKQYKLEFVVSDESLAEKLLEIINSIEFINFKMTKRKNSSVIYTRDSKQIERILILIGAKNSAMEIMQEKMYKEAVNNINRQSNFETANIDKTISASAKQIVAIANIFDTKGKDFLETELLEIAMYRLEHQETSLKEMSEHFGASRSAINHKLSKIISISEKLKEGE